MKTFFKAGIVVLTAFASSCSETDNQPALSPSSVQFAQDLSIVESSGPGEAAIIFDKKAGRDGKLSISASTAVPGSFYTEPELLDGKLEVPVAKGLTKVEFKIYPVDNNVLDESRTITLEITGVSAGFAPGEKKIMSVEITDDEAPVTPSFAADRETIREDDEEGISAAINFSSAIPGTGKIIIEQTTTSGNTSFTILPPPGNDGKLVLEAPLGATGAGFKILPLNDNIITGHDTVEFRISRVEGALIEGNENSFIVTILDDELVSKPRGYENSGGGWSSREIYEYDEAGRIHKVIWETKTPGTRNGVRTYYYDQNGLIQRINHYPNHDEYFFTGNGKIVRSEVIENSEKKSYILYNYDDEGNVAGKEEWFLQPSGHFKREFILVFLYFTEGDIYKQLTYHDADEAEEPVLVSTRTYDGYLDKPNPFPMTEIFPNEVIQRRLPTVYRIQEGNADLTYTLSYEFRNDGLPVKRHASGPKGSEVVVFLYY